MQKICFYATDWISYKEAIKRKRAVSPRTQLYELHSSKLQVCCELPLLLKLELGSCVKHAR